MRYHEPGVVLRYPPEWQELTQASESKVLGFNLTIPVGPGAAGACRATGVTRRRMLGATCACGRLALCGQPAPVLHTAACSAAAVPDALPADGSSLPAVPQRHVE